MARIPGVPTLDPIELPRESPQQAGRPGEAVQESAQSVQDDLQLQNHIREAQKQVDTLSARNQLNAAYTQMQDRLAKTKNSGDVPGVVQQTQDTLNEISRQWSKSPAVVSIQQDAESLRPSVEHLGTVAQVKLMGDEFNINLAQQSTVFAEDYATARTVGDGQKEQSALNAFTQAVNGGVKTGLIGAVEAQDTIRKFRESGQELQIAKAIENADPKANQAIFDEMNAHPENFPDVPAEKMSAYKEHAQSAVESHIRLQQWADGQMATNTMLRPLINQWTNPATGQFDEEKALGDVAEQFRTGKISVYAQDALTKGINAYAADKDGANKKQADQFQDSIVKLFHDHKYAEADAKLEQGRPWLEQNDFGELYKGLLNYGDTQLRTERAEGREERSLELAERQDRSYATFGRLQLSLAQGHLYTDTQILNMVGTGPNQLLPQQAQEAMNLVHSYQKDPDYQSALSLLSSSFPPPAKLAATADADEVSAYADTSARQEKAIAMTYEAWQKRVNENPTEDKLKVMRDVMQPAIQKNISDQINQIFGAVPKKPFSFSSLFTEALGSGPEPDKTNTPTVTPSSDDSGRIRVREKSTGRMGTIPSSEYDDQKYDRVP